MEDKRREDYGNTPALIESVKGGDRGAFQALVGLYQQKVFAMAYAVLHDKEDAMDIVQETFLRVYQKMDTFKPGSNFLNWLLQITKNLCIDYYRKHYRNRRELESAANTDDLDTAADPQPDPQGSSDLRRIFALCVDKLAPRQKMVFVMRHYSELQFNEISEAMNVSIGTAKSLHFKAVQNLKKSVGPYLGKSHE